MKYIYTISQKSHYTKTGCTFSSKEYNHRDALAFYRFYSAEAEMEGSSVTLSVRSVDPQGKIINSCVLRHCDYYNPVPEV